MLLLLSCEKKPAKSTGDSIALLLRKAENHLKIHRDSTLLITQKVLRTLPNNIFDKKEQY
jgi:hypothetical protein